MDNIQHNIYNMTATQSQIHGRKETRDEKTLLCLLFQNMFFKKRYSILCGETREPQILSK
jgi:hypothetical protein